ncbi:hypothetical protein ACTXT7_013324 [Hymenolepis weldensis]
MDNVQISAHKSKKQLMAEYEERRTITLWNRPLTTSYYFLLECTYRLARLFHKVLRYKMLTFLSSMVLIGYYFLRSAPGPHQAGPFIAQVTMSAYICQSLDFPEPPYPDQIICPPSVNGSTSNVSFYSVIRKVQAEAMFWGLGTAIGELPPYFMARTSRLSGEIQDEVIELSSDFSPSSSDADGDSIPLVKKSEREMTLLQNVELFLQRLITRAGFIGILLCASFIGAVILVYFYVTSDKMCLRPHNLARNFPKYDDGNSYNHVPNPLFDFAGMTCGHFLVPFSTFFGATLIGKAIIKTHIQTFFVILMSSEDHIEMMVHLLGKIPVFGANLQQPFLEYLQHQKDKLLNKVITTKTSWIQSVVQTAVTVAMIIFAISLVNAMAQNCHRRMCQRGQADVTVMEKNSSSRTEIANGGLKED